MKALSIKQPWAWFILEGNPPKLYENRAWNKQYLDAQLKLCPIGNNFLVHASKGVTRTEYEEACEFAAGCGVMMFPKFEDLHRGGIVGVVRLQAVVRASHSPWFTGPLALKLADPYPLPFQPCKGALGFFDATYYAPTTETINPETDDE